MRETMVSSMPDSTNASSKELVSIRTLCGMLDMKERTIREKVATRKIPYYKLGKLIRFDIGEIRGWYRSSRVDSLTPDVIRGKIL
jgi:excisionase family DNA binding protein